MYSVLIHKATRGTRVVERGLSFRKALEKADTVYEGWKAIHRSFPELTVSGVSVRIVRDEDAEAVINDHRTNDARIMGCYGAS